jgi:hypothetical protein
MSSSISRSDESLYSESFCQIKKLASRYIGNTKDLKTLEAGTTMSSQNITNEYLVMQDIVQEELMPEIPPPPLFLLLLLTCRHPLQKYHFKSELKIMTTPSTFPNKESVICGY